MATLMRDAKAPRQDADGYLPSPEEISLACLTIQARWSDEERAQRRAWPDGLIHLSRAVDPERHNRGFGDPDLND